MKTLQEISKLYTSNTLDGRDLGRLAKFIPYDMLPFCGIYAKEGVTKEEWDKTTIEFTKENILVQLEEDVAFGFRKALNKRGVSASIMANVVMMWNWILEEGLEDLDSYPMYGLPIFKATALKYGFENEIGDDEGNEDYYDCENY